MPAPPHLRPRGGDRPVAVITVDDLPALLPVESSRAFPAGLWPRLPALGDGAGAWVRCPRSFAGAAGPRAARAHVEEAAHVR